MHPRKNHDSLKTSVRLGTLAALLLTVTPALAVNVVVQLRNGDRITGELIAQETNQVLIATSWAGTLSLPLSVIGGLRTATGADLLAPPPAPVATVVPATAPQTVAAQKPKPAAPVPAARPKRLRNNLQVGSNLVSGSRDQESVYVRVKSTYEKPYQQDAKKFFRATADYTADYGETEDVRSANRMYGSFKTDFDLGSESYSYNVASAGFDEIRRIDLQYEVGPGLGYHLIKEPTFTLNVESGVNYQVQERSTGENLESVYWRVGEDMTWKFGPRLSFIKKVEFFLDGQNAEEFRFRLDSTLSYKFIENLSLNLTVLDLYESNPATRVNRNELQIRSAIGVTF